MVKDLIKLEVSFSMGDHDNPHKASSIIVSNISVSPNSIINIDIVVNSDSKSHQYKL